jgi:predicted permease
MLKKEAVDFLNKIIYFLLLPCYILVNYQSIELNWELLCAFLFGITANMTTLLLAYVLSNSQKIRIQQDTMMILSGYSIFSFVLPIITLFYDASICMYAIAFGYGNALMILGGNHAFASNASAKRKNVQALDLLKPLFKSLPFDLCLLLIVLLVFRANMPSSLNALFSVCASAFLFCCFLMYGLLLEPGMKKGSWIYSLKLFLMRILVNVLFGLLVYFAFPFEMAAKQVLLLCLASPCALSAPVFCLQNKSRGKIISMMMLLSMIASMLAMTILTSIAFS